MTRTITILGCGSSGGVPRVGQGWGACDPNNPKNQRRRCSVLIEQTAEDNASTRVLIDTSPDMRMQLLDADVDRLDAILLTHPHADHVNGIDDVRPLVIEAGQRLPIHMDAATSAVVTRGFGYIFETPPGSNYPPLLDEHRIHAGHPVVLTGPGGVIEALPFDLNHGEIDALGYRIGDMAYTPDVKAIPDVSVPFLRDLDLWVIDALRYRPHPSHFSLDEAMSWLERMKPRRAVLTNLHTDMDFETLRRRLPDGVEPAYDGMRLDF